jgi:hypothetical protein
MRWSRYAELFSYDERLRQFALNEKGVSEHPG